MSQTISLKKQIEDRWIYHFCKDNVPAADQDDDAIRNQRYAPPRRRPPRPSAQNNNHSNDDSDGGHGDGNGDDSDNGGHGGDGGDSDNGSNGADGGDNDNGGNGSDGGDSDNAGHGGDGEGAHGDNNGDPDNGAESDDSGPAQPALDNKLPIRVCIGYQFQKYQTPPMPQRRRNVTVAARKARRDQQLLTAGIRNHQVASVLSAATRKTCLLDYARICDYLLQSTTNDSHVYTYRLFSLQHTVRIDSFDWPQTQRGIRAAAGVNRVMIGNNLIAIVHRDIATLLSPDVGRQWILRQTVCTDDAKAVWTRQNGLCAYCDVMTAPPDGEGVATCCTEYAGRIFSLSDTAKMRKMKQDANTELGRLVYDRVLFGERSVFVCMACVQVHAVNRLDKVLGFSHSPVMPVPLNIGHNDDVLFDYLAACSGLHLVFSMFLCEVDLRQAIQSPGATVATAATTVAGGLRGRIATTSQLVPSTALTIMAYVTNLREAELVYLRVDESQLAPYLRQQLRTGFTRNHPNLANAALHVLAERSPDTTNAATTISSRWHIFHCIHDNQDRRVLNFLQQRAPVGSNYARRVFVYLCQHLYTGMPNMMAANSAMALWDLLRDRLQHRFPDRADISRDSIGFRSTVAPDQQHHSVFCENTVLLVRRDTRDEPGVAQLIVSLCLEHCAETHIMDSIVLVQNECPTSMLTLTQNVNQHHLYRLVAVCDVDGAIMHWLNVENWNHLKTMPTDDLFALQWFSTNQPAAGAAPDLIDRPRSFHDVRTTLLDIRAHAPVSRTAGIEASRYVCFYQRLSRSQDKAHAVPICMLSHIARRQTRSLRLLFGANARIMPAALRAVVATTPAMANSSIPVFDEGTQRCVRTMAVAIKLLGFIAVHELHAALQYLPVEPARCHLFVYLLWNKFVILEGFDLNTEQVHAGVVLGQGVHVLGDIDLDAMLVRFRQFLDQQCVTLHASRTDDIRDAFVSTRALLTLFHEITFSQYTCTTTRHAHRNLKVFEGRVALHQEQDIYTLGNTKLMLHYFSCVLGFRVLQVYLSCIRDNLV